MIPKNSPEENQISLLSQIFLFYFFSLSLFGIEIFVLILAAPFLFHSALVAVALSFCLFTFFSFFIIRTYLQSHWQEKSYALGKEFLAKNFPPGPSCHEKKIELLFSQIRAVHSYTPEFPWFWSRLHYPLFHFFLRDEWTQIELILLSICEKIAEEWLVTSPLNLEAHAAFVEIHKARAEKLYSLHKEKEAALEETKAVEELLILHDLSPDEPWIFAELGRLYHKAGRFDEEIALYEKWIAIEPEKEELQISIARLYFAAGRKSKGFRIYSDLRIRNPKSADRLMLTLFEPLPK